MILNHMVYFIIRVSTLLLQPEMILETLALILQQQLPMRELKINLAKLKKQWFSHYLFLAQL